MSRSSPGEAATRSVTSGPSRLPKRWQERERNGSDPGCISIHLTLHAPQRGIYRREKHSVVRISDGVSRAMTSLLLSPLPTKALFWLKTSRRTFRQRASHPLGSRTIPSFSRAGPIYHITQELLRDAGFFVRRLSGFERFGRHSQAPSRRVVANASSRDEL